MGMFLGSLLLLTLAFFNVISGSAVNITARVGSGYVSFYTRSHFRGEQYKTRYEPGCHNMPAMFSANTASINTHDECVSVYSDMECAGDTKKYYPGSLGHDYLGEWKNRIKSWEPCITPNETETETSRPPPPYVSFFTETHFEGSELMADYTAGCHDMPEEFSAKTKSVNTHDKCARVYSGAGCTGEMRDYYPGSRHEHHDLHDWSDTIRSWQVCPLSVRFYDDKDYRGSSYSADYMPGCHELPRNYRGDSQSLKTGGECIRVFALGECTGENKEFSGDHSDLLEWNLRVRSFDICSSPVPLQPEVSRVTFFYRTDFRGREDTQILSPECHVIRGDLQANTESLDAESNCVTVYSTSDCTGRPKNFSGAHDNLDTWRNKINSFEICSANSTPKVSYVDFFLFSNFQGESLEMSYTSGCHELPNNFRGKTESLKTEGKCIRAFTLGGCTGKSKEFSTDQAGLGDWDYMIRSWESCSSPVQMQPSEPRVTFFYLRNFRGREHTGIINENCQNIPENLAKNTESLDAGESCVAVYTNNDCTGARKNFTGAHADLEEWKNEVSSYGICTASPPEEEPVDNEIVFFHFKNFTGNSHLHNAGCHELPSGFGVFTGSLRTGSSCVRVFSQKGCAGNSQEFSGSFGELGEWKNKIRSYQVCETRLGSSTFRPAYQLRGYKQK